MSKNYSKSKKVYAYIQNENPTQALASTKKPYCSSESENATARQNLLNFKLSNRSLHKSALEYLDLEEYVDNMHLKNRTKCAADTQFDPPDLIRMSKFIYNHNNELGQGDKLKEDKHGSSFNNIIDPYSLDNVDSIIKHTSDKVDVLDYNNNNVDKWNYNDEITNYNELEHKGKAKLADQNERINNDKPEYIFNPEAKKPGYLVIEHLKSQETYTDTPEYRSNQHAQVKRDKGSENLNKVEYVYFDKSESDEENEDDKTKPNKTDKTDYVQVPIYEMEKTLVKDKCKLKTHFNYYCSSNVGTRVMGHRACLE